MKKATRKSKFVTDIDHVIESIKSGGHWGKESEQVFNSLQFSRFGSRYKVPTKRHLHVGDMIWIIFPNSLDSKVIFRAEIVGIKKRPGSNDLVSYIERDKTGNGKVGSADSCFVWTTSELLKTLSVMQTGQHKTKRKANRIDRAGTAIDRSDLF